MSKPFVAILIGADSDLPVMEAAFGVLDKFDIPFEVKVSSAHHSPDSTRDYVSDADQRGCAAFICASGVATHLAVAVSAATLRPVIGVPIDVSAGDLNTLLPTVQTPGGFPVATVATGKVGAQNAAYLAAQILACVDTDLHQKLVDERRANAEAVVARDVQLQKDLQSRRSR
ncbi:5-(carboxyamino)imidazole ribonucleotide mutase [Microbulbifer sp. SAOS-129_SWC]|uniref:5-(carboxyamino)imidazole ribonucleotide mutase n=1 Tax=Microbulbifer sp. SAOS-129_SWC TaxID=3145235 RepID=UPI0032180A0F